MRHFILLTILIPLLSVAQHNNSAHMNFQTRAMVQNRLPDDQVSIFVRGDVNRIKEYLESANAKIKGQLRNLILTELTIRDVLYLSEQEFIEGFEFEWGRNLVMNDSMLLKNNVAAVHSGVHPLPTSYSGKDVISGVIDTGIDPLHRDFQNMDSSTRILRIWDQTLVFDPVLTPSFGYGQEFDSSSINAGTYAHLDSDNHGTGVASVMAGNGWHSGELKGVAPESDLVIVELDFTGANLTASVDAFKYIYDVADSEDKPCVINASYGDYLGSHDGLDATALFLDSLIDEKPGRLFVAAAGNSGDWGPYHLKHAVSGADTNFTWFSPNSSSTAGSTVFLDIWADTADLNDLSFSIGADHNTSFAHGGHLIFRNVLADNLIGNTVIDTIFSSGNKMAEVQLYTELRGGQYNLQIYLPNIDSTNYNYSLISVGDGELDLWSISYLGLYFGSDIVWLSNMVNSGFPVTGTWPSISNYQLPDSSQSVVSGFQCSDRVVTVGQYVNRSEYTDFLGDVQVCPQLTDSLAMNSSAGPTRSGRLKPDVNSTGFWVMSALPVDRAISMQGGSSAWRLIQSGFHTRRAGTSFSSPVVAGLGALLLEKCPELTAQEFVGYLHSTSYADQYTGALPNNRWGYGKTDALALLSATNLNPNVIGDTSFCFGGSTVLATDSVYANYNWNGLGSTSTYQYYSSTTGFLIVQDDRGCLSDTVFYTLVEHDSIPVPVIVDNGDGSATTALSDSIQWYSNGSIAVGENDTVYIASDPTGVWVYAEHIDSNGCSVFTDSVFISSASMSEYDIEYLLFPNPVMDKLQISSSTKIDFVELVDLNGKLIMKSFVNGLEGEINLSQVVRGVYILRIINEKESHIVKIQVSR